MSKADRSKALDAAQIDQLLTVARGIESASLEAALRAALAVDADDDTRRVNVEAFESAAAKVAEGLTAIQAEAGAKGGLDAGAQKLIGRLVDRLSQIGDKLARGERPPHGELQKLTDFAMGELRSAMSDHLAKLETNAASAKQTSAASSKEARAVIDSAVDEIDQISLNVRLISLNASVEAARAGEAGRGFGVIAAEIQNLATRSQVAVESVRRQLASIG